MNLLAALSPSASLVFSRSVEVDGWANSKCQPGFKWCDTFVSWAKSKCQPGWTQSRSCYCLNEEWIYWLYQVQVQPGSIKCDKVNVIQGKWWIFWLCQAQVPVRLNQVLKWMIKLLLSKWIDGGSCWSKSRRPAWLNELMNVGQVKPRKPACWNGLMKVAEPSLNGQPG